MVALASAEGMQIRPPERIQTPSTPASGEKPLFANMDAAVDEVRATARGEGLKGAWNKLATGVNSVVGRLNNAVQDVVPAVSIGEITTANKQPTANDKYWEQKREALVASNNSASEMQQAVDNGGNFSQADIDRARQFGYDAKMMDFAQNDPNAAMQVAHKDLSLQRALHLSQGTQDTLTTMDANSANEMEYAKWEDYARAVGEAGMRQKQSEGATTADVNQAGQDAYENSILEFTRKQTDLARQFAAENPAVQKALQIIDAEAAQKAADEAAKRAAVPNAITDEIKAQFAALPEDVQQRVNMGQEKVYIRGDKLYTAEQYAALKSTGEAVVLPQPQEQPTVEAAPAQAAALEVAQPAAENAEQAAQIAQLRQEVEDLKKEVKRLQEAQTAGIPANETPYERNTRLYKEKAEREGRALARTVSVPDNKPLFRTAAILESQGNTIPDETRRGLRGALRDTLRTNFDNLDAAQRGALSNMQLELTAASGRGELFTTGGEGTPQQQSEGWLKRLGNMFDRKSSSLQDRAEQALQAQKSRADIDRMRNIAQSMRSPLMGT